MPVSVVVVVVRPELVLFASSQWATISAEGPAKVSRKPIIVVYYCNDDLLDRGYGRTDAGSAVARIRGRLFRPRAQPRKPLIVVYYCNDDLLDRGYGTLALLVQESERRVNPSGMYSLLHWIA
jgi:hypothetical protein